MPTHKTLQHLCPNIKPIDTHIPFELLLITGLDPDKVSGFSSSLFFTLDNEKIGAYIPRERAQYIHILKKAKILTEKQIWDTKKIAKQLEKDKIFELVNNNKSDWYLKINETTLLNIFNDNVLTLLKETPRELIIQKNKKKEIYQKEEFYRYRLKK